MTTPAVRPQGAGVAAATLVRTVDPPQIHAQLPGWPGGVSAYVGVRIDAAISLLESREFTGLDRDQRLRVALTDQRRLLAGLLGYAGRAAFDLRVVADPRSTPRVRVAILGRVWADSANEAAAAAADLSRYLLASLPRHVVGGVITEQPELERWLDPYPGRDIEAAVIAKVERMAAPTRGDAMPRRHFSIVPFDCAVSDWSSLYEALDASLEPVTVSTAIFPSFTPPHLQNQLSAWATYYGRLSREDEVRGGLYYGRRKLPPDAFAAEAERVFQDLLRRCGETAFAIRAQVSGPRVPPGLVEAAGAVISPPDLSPGGRVEDRTAATYEARWLLGPDGARRARRNLADIDCHPAPGRPDIWQAADSPPPGFAVLSVLGDAAEAASAFRLPVAVDGVVPGFIVRRGQFGQRQVNVPDGPAITVGAVSGTADLLTLALADLTRHALIAGSTGSGKTTTVLELLRQLWLDHGVPFLVIEPVNSAANDYRKLAGVPGFDSLSVITVGDESQSPLRFNPFEVPAGVLVGEHIMSVLECFKAAFGLWEPLPSIYQEALNLTYLEAGILASETGSAAPRAWPTVVEFLKAMRRVTESLSYAGEVKSNIQAASVRRAEQLVSGPSASAYLTTERFDVQRLLYVPLVIELKALGGGDDQALMMALLLNAITEYYKANRVAADGIRHVTVVEEAHRLLSRSEGGRKAEDAQAKEKAAEEFANTLAENRKYGEGVIIVEQIPSKLVVDAVKNTNLKVMHRLTSEEDRRYLGESMGMDEPQQRFAARLTTGEALVYGDAFPEAVHVETRRTIVVGPATPEPAANPPFSACGPCRAKCHFRGASLALTRHPEIRATLTNARRALAAAGLSTAEIDARWEALITSLRDTVSRFPALPSEEPSLSDAMYCLFLHSLAVDSMTAFSEWPAAVAEVLGLATARTSGG